jgi:hypothetical protein
LENLGTGKMICEKCDCEPHLIILLQENLNANYVLHHCEEHNSNEQVPSAKKTNENRNNKTPETGGAGRSPTPTNSAAAETGRYSA